MPRKYTVAVIPGDGIGPEVIDQAVRITKEAVGIVGSKIVFENYEGGARYWLRNGRDREWKDGTFEKCQKADAVLLGAIGLPEAKYPDGRVVGGKIIFGLRMGLDLYANVRPSILLEGIKSPLSHLGSDGKIDFVVVRENTEEMYSQIQGMLKRGGVAESGVDVSIVTAKGARRISEYAFKLSSKRKGTPSDGRKRVICVDKSNVLSGSILFRSIFKQVGRNYPAIAKDYAFVDAMAQWLIRKPEEYDVIVTTNLFGDILSDLGAGLVGGLGLAPSANIGDSHAMFEPVHGSAPTHAGKNTANPIATILSATMLLEWLAKKRRDAKMNRATKLVRKAVSETLMDPKNHTRDLGGQSSTRKTGQAVMNNLTKLESST
ncbi:MAG TPA: isocitrate/isopropylmalate family dehydrogenase [Candidatus Bathyarchaeia archaeon]|nr:isocitrate/isopropylmalate family dehydrogenase [Candidatus Bathyarchaeia archaeon]